MPFDAGAIVARLELDKKKWEESIKALKKDQRSLDGFILRNEESFKKFGRSLMVAGAAAVASIGFMIHSVTELGHEINEMSKRTGISVELLSSYKLAADKSGASLDDFARGMRGLANNLMNANTGSATAIATFKRLHVSYETGQKKIRPLNEVMLDLADTFMNMADGETKLALAMDIFGRSGMMLIPFLNLGRKGLLENAAAAAKLGIVFTAQAAEACNRFVDTMKEVKGAVTGASKELTMALLPTVQSIAETVRDAIVTFKNWTQAHPELAKVIITTTAALGLMAIPVGFLISKLPALIAGFKALSIFLASTLGFVTANAILAIPVLVKMYADALKEINAVEKAQNRVLGSVERQNVGLRAIIRNLSPFKGITPSEDWKKWFEEKDRYFKMLEFGAKAVGKAIGMMGVSARSALTPLTDWAKTLTKYGVLAPEEFAARLKTLRDDQDKLTRAWKSGAIGADIYNAAIKKIREEIEKLIPGQKSLKEELDITFKTEVQARINKINEALRTMGDRMTPEKAFELTEELNKLQSAMTGVAVQTTGYAVPAFRDMTNVIELTGMASQDWYVKINILAKYLARSIPELAAQIIEAMNMINAAFRTGLPPIDPTKYLSGLKTSAEKTTTEVKNYFDGLMNDIAIGFADAIEQALTGTASEQKKRFNELKVGIADLKRAYESGYLSFKQYQAKYKEMHDEMTQISKNFKNFFVSIWETIKKAFFRVIGEMLADFITRFVKGVLVGMNVLKAVGNAWDLMFAGLKAGAEGVGAATKGIGTGVVAGTSAASKGFAALGLKIAGVIASIAICATVIAGFFDAIFSNQKKSEAAYRSECRWIDEMTARWKKMGWTVAQINDELARMSRRELGTYGQWLEKTRPGRKERGESPGEQRGESRWAAGFEGVVSRPTSVVIGESGPEYVKVEPIDRRPGASVNIYLSMNGIILTDREYARNRILPEIIDALNSNAGKSRILKALGMEAA